MKTKHVSVPHEVDAVQLTSDLIIDILRGQVDGYSIMGYAMNMVKTENYADDSPKFFINYPDGRSVEVVVGDYLLFRPNGFIIVPRLLFESMYVLPEEVPDKENMTYDDIREVVKKLERFKNLDAVSFMFCNDGPTGVRFVEIRIPSK